MRSFLHYTHIVQCRVFTSAPYMYTHTHTHTHLQQGRQLCVFCSVGWGTVAGLQTHPWTSQVLALVAHLCLEVEGPGVTWGRERGTGGRHINTSNQEKLQQMLSPRSGISLAEPHYSSSYHLLLKRDGRGWTKGHPKRVAVRLEKERKHSHSQKTHYAYSMVFPCYKLADSMCK